MIGHLRDFTDAALQDFPFCVVGAGAAGIALAVALGRQGHRVLLLDAGDRHESAELADAYAGDADAPHAATTDYRRQRFGGTTHLWGGRCVPLDELDLARRAHVPHSGWPIAYRELAEHYPQAMDYCDAGAADFSPRSLQGPPAAMFADLPRLAPDIEEHIERYSLPTDFGTKFGEELAGSALIQVVLRARCVGLSLDAAGGRVESLRVTDGARHAAVRAGHVVLCGGGIEVPRLLLATQRRTPAWARFDASLGRYYACHYDLIFGDLAFTGERPLFRFQKTTDGVYARRKLQFSSNFQARHGLLNSAFRLHFPAYADPSHGSGVLSTIYLAKSVIASEHQTIMNHGERRQARAGDRLLHLRNVATDLGSVAGFGWDWLTKRKFAKRKLPYTLIANRNGSYPLEFNSEQVPDAANRIELLDATDRDGLPRVAVRWGLRDIDVASGITSFQQMQRLFGTTSDCRLRFDAGELRERVAAALPVGGHHIGATRMGTSPSDSVVDRDCRVHGVENLFVASASVFTTSSHANPTLTIVALALRLARHLGGPAAVRPPAPAERPATQDA